ncbi:LuxR C-terminal-related transcriptional regulator [Rhizobium sp. CF122]|uniref:LuxR C-terminal-related transcriptional regulator n=1 Tax=Rhizobium sp. CF122 TaxID=1144312 RepID=UPI0009DA3080
MDGARARRGAAGRRGCSDKDIARVLNIGFATVRTHLENCLTKLQCSNRAEMAALVSRLSH